MGHEPQSSLGSASIYSSFFGHDAQTVEDRMDLIHGITTQKNKTPKSMDYMSMLMAGALLRVWQETHVAWPTHLEVI